MAQEMSLEVVKGISRVKYERTIASQILKKESPEKKAFILTSGTYQWEGACRELQIIQFISQKQN